MTGLGFLDLVIGLVFIYFILSLVVTVIQEIRANFFRLRSRNLEIWFQDTLVGQKDNLGKLLFRHKLIDGLVRKRRNPAYVPHEHFVSALLDIVHNDSMDGNATAAPYDIDTLKESVMGSQLLPEDLKRFILQSISEASGELKKVKEDIALWYDNAMTRITGTYKNIHQWFVVLVSFVVVAAFNADTISLSKYLYENEGARTALADRVEEAVNEGDLQELLDKYNSIDSAATDEKLDSVKVIIKNIQGGIKKINAISEQIKDYNLPLGWTKKAGLPTDKPKGGWAWLMKIIGLSITALAVSLGSNFWFDMLNKLVNLRGAGNKPKEAVAEKTAKTT